MAGTYVEEFGGYVADVPRLWFKRCSDSRVFYFDELTQATVTPNIQTIDINAGWSVFPVTSLPGTSTFEMQITSGKFEAELFAMTNGKNFETNSSYRVPVTEILDVDTSGGGYAVSTTETPVAGTVYINGLAVTTDYTLAGKVITFTADPGAEKVKVSYEYTAMAQETKIDNRSSAIGEAVLKYPVYSSGEDCTDSGIIGHVLMRVYRARITQQPGLDGSYKTASTYAFTLSALDPHRPNDEVYSVAFIRNA